MITAPYNFVPLNEKVFFPDWAEDVSHDIPFSDGESGVIDITITAKSPIFIRDHENPELFCQHDGEYYIPSSSVKGMVRNVLEIMSFSKMSQFDDDTYTVRDLQNCELYMSKMTPDNTFCGFLKKEGNDYYIEDCGKPGRVRHEEIDKIFGIDFASKFKHGRFENKAKDKTAEIKYDLIKSNNLVHGFEYVKKDVNREIYCYNNNSNKKGTLVLTGQPSARKEPEGQKPSGKIYEFVFFDSQKDILVEKNVIENFLFAYFDKRDTQPKESPDWTYWKKKLKNGEKVPVFFQKNGSKIAHFGLSYLYKLPYNHSVKDGINSEHFKDEKDLAQTIFGYANKTDALKGRVQFSHFKAIDNLKVLSKKTEILGTPRASYYPIYVKQKGELFTTFMDEFEIAGRKRYPIHKDNETASTENTGNDNVGTTFIPLKNGVVFKGKLRYHNLKKAELGAIFSALTFHNTPNTYHNIGMAKSLGYGKIDIELSGIKDIAPYLKEFESKINENIFDWANQEQIEELLTMASEQANQGNSILRYMELSEFASCKTGNDKDCLRNYTSLDYIKAVKVKSLLSSEELNSIKAIQEKNELERVEKEKKLKEEQKLEAERIAKEEAEQKALKEAKKVFQDELNTVLKTNNIQILENFIKKHSEYKKIDEIKTKLEELKNSQESDKFTKADASAKAAYEALEKKIGNAKQYGKEKEKFIKKWSADKNNKKSPFILELVEKAKKNH